MEDLLTVEDLNRCTEMGSVQESRAQYGKDRLSYDRQGYKELRVWQASMDLVQESYRLSATFPPSEQFGLTSQMRRAANSVSLNIAEGWGRNSRPEFARFTDIARGSLCELDSSFEIAKRLQFVTTEGLEQAVSQVDSVGAMLYRLRAYLRKPLAFAGR